ncbi:MAG: hypothetical protein JWM12_168 [Ilumatobacteraceae bacterium]|nr:hypothetical protein [Ilumatobacteraceae bacterium]
MTLEEFIAAACPPIADLGGAFYFRPETVARGKEHGLDAFRFYFVGRGGVLGDTSAAVVRSAFGYFNPALLTKMWETAGTKLAPSDAAILYWDACADLGRTTLGDVDGLGGFVAAAEAVVGAADASSLTLFAGIKQMPLADDLPGRAMQLIAVLREFRGSAHLVAVRALGLTDSIAHFIKRPDMVEGFGWKAEDADAIIDADRTKLTEAEALTDRIVGPAYAVLDDAGREALLDGLGAIGKAVHATS